MLPSPYAQADAVLGKESRARPAEHLTVDLDLWQPTAEGFNRLPSPLRDYIHDLETRADPAGEVQELALARVTIGALEKRIRELEQKA